MQGACGRSKNVGLAENSRQRQSIQEGSSMPSVRSENDTSSLACPRSEVGIQHESAGVFIFTTLLAATGVDSKFVGSLRRTVRREGNVSCLPHPESCTKRGLMSQSNRWNWPVSTLTVLKHLFRCNRYGGRGNQSLRVRKPQSRDVDFRMLCVR